MYFSRREQFRLLMLVFTLGLVLVLMRHAARPENWYWLWGGAPPSEEATPKRTGLISSSGESIDTRLSEPSRNQRRPVGSFLSRGDPVVDDATAKDFFPGVAAEHLARIRDDSGISAEEHGAWFHLMSILRNAESRELAEASRGRIAFAQLFGQPGVYRGELVTLRGTVRRVVPQEAPQNDDSIENYYQLWLQPEDSPTNPIVVDCLELPSGFPTGLDLHEPVELTGFSFKRFAYVARDTKRAAPLVLAKMPSWARVVRRSNSSISGRSMAYISAVALAFSVFAVTWIWRQSRLVPSR